MFLHFSEAIGITFKNEEENCAKEKGNKRENFLD